MQNQICAVLFNSPSMDFVISITFYLRCNRVKSSCQIIVFIFIANYRFASFVHSKINRFGKNHNSFSRKRKKKQWSEWISWKRKKRPKWKLYLSWNENVKVIESMNRDLRIRLKLKGINDSVVGIGDWNTRAGLANAILVRHYVSRSLLNSVCTIGISCIICTMTRWIS